MGDVIGGLFGGGYDQKAANQALTGFNWLKDNPQLQGYINNGSGANSAIAALLGLGGDSAAAKSAFNNYLDSTGYKFNLQQGTGAINANAASRGLLNSGATGKALTSYGQNLGSQYFNSYLGQLGGLAGEGLQGINMIGQAGTTGGANAAQYTSQAGQQYGMAGAGLLGGALGLFGL